ncbi:MAG: hypothetical protein ACPG19_05445 [Saprospiraceae bacterium]
MNRKAVLSIIGFCLFIFGFLSLLLSIVGIKIVFLLWLDYFGGLVGMLLKLSMIIAGIVIVVVTRGDEARFDDYLDEYEVEK